MKRFSRSSIFKIKDEQFLLQQFIRNMVYVSKNPHKFVLDKNFFVKEVYRQFFKNS
jgi:hypothetical protein